MLVSAFLSANALIAPAQDVSEEVEEIEEIEEVTDLGSVSWRESENYPIIDRVVNVLTPRTLRKNALFFVVDHRTRKAAKEDAFQELLGYDSGGLKVGLGLRYGILDHLEAGFYRLNGTTEIFDVYEFDFKYRALNQNRHHLDLALRGGVTWFAQRGIEDASAFFGQLLIGKTLFGRASVGTGLLFHTDSSSDLKSRVDEDYSAAVPVQLAIRLSRRFAWNLEIVPNVAGFGLAHPAISTSLKIITHRHTFSLIVSNTQYISADGIVANSYRSLKEAIVGFTITREFNL